MARTPRDRLILPKDERPQLAAQSQHPVIEKLFGKEWHVVKGAPLSFVLSVAVVSVAIWYAIDYLYSAQIRAKDATIQTLSLRPESVPAQEAEVRKLKAEVEQLKSEKSSKIAKTWRPLSESEIQAWARELAPFKGRYVAVQVSDSNSEDFGRTLYRVFSDAKWENVSFGMNYWKPGISVLANSKEPALPKLKELFAAIGCPISLVSDVDLGTIYVYIGDKSDAQK